MNENVFIFKNMYIYNFLLKKIIRLVATASQIVSNY
jgi:hypothetical protein